MTVIDIINLTPSVSLDADVLEEVWSRKKVSYNHLKVFGSRAFFYISKDEQAKLNSKMKECIYLGSPINEFGYQIWDPINRKVVRSIYVVFFEDQTIEDIQRSEKPKLRVSRNVYPDQSLDDLEEMVENGDVNLEACVIISDQNCDKIVKEE